MIGLPVSCVNILAEDWQAVMTPAPAADSADAAGDTMASERCPSEPHEGTESLRINIKLLDDLMNMASELVLAQPAVDPAGTRRILGCRLCCNVDRLTSSIQEKIMPDPDATGGTL